MVLAAGFAAWVLLFNPPFGRSPYPGKGKTGEPNTVLTQGQPQDAKLIARYEKGLREANEKNQAFARITEERNAQLAVLETSLKSQQETNGRLTQELAERNNQVADLQRTLEGERQKSGELAQRLGETDARGEEAKTALQGEREKSDALAKLLEKSNAQAEEARIALQGEQEENGILAKQLEETNKQIEETQASLNGEREKAAGLARELETLRQELGVVRDAFGDIIAIKYLAGTFPCTVEVSAGSKTFKVTGNNTGEFRARIAESLKALAGERNFRELRILNSDIPGETATLALERLAGDYFPGIAVTKIPSGN